MRVVLDTNLVVSLAPEEQLRLLVQYLAPASPAVLQEPWPALPARCRDRKDEMFIALAIQEQVPRVSGDADLTSMAAALPLPILRAAELRLLLEAPDRQH